MLRCAVSHCEASEHRRRALGSPAQLIPKSWSGSLASPGTDQGRLPGHSSLLASCFGPAGRRHRERLIRASGYPALPGTGRVAVEHLGPQLWETGVI